MIEPTTNPVTTVNAWVPFLLICFLPGWLLIMIMGLVLPCPFLTAGRRIVSSVQDLSPYHESRRLTRTNSCKGKLDRPLSPPPLSETNIVRRKYSHSLLTDFFHPSALCGARSS